MCVCVCVCVRGGVTLYTGRDQEAGWGGYMEVECCGEISCILVYAYICVCLQLISTC